MSNKRFYAAGGKGEYNVKRVPFHVLLSTAERNKLARMSHAHKISGAAVVRLLISRAK